MILAAITILSVGLFSAATADDVQAEWGNYEIADYTVGDEFSAGRDVKVGGTDYRAVAVLTFPDTGRTISIADGSDPVVFTVAGKYVYSHKVTVGGVTYRTAEESFIVADKLWKIGHKDSSVSYGHDPLASDGKNGLLVRLAEGDELKFTKPIDISGISPSQPILSAFITPDQRGILDFDIINFKLTDATDPSVYIVYQGIRSYSSVRWQGTSYWKAAGQGQPLTGYESGKNVVHVNNQWGASLMHSFVAQRYAYSPVPGVVPVNSDEREIEIQFDKADLAAKVAGVFISDLDDSAYYEEQWSGFKSDKVFLSITADGYNAMTANFCISSLLGYDLTSENVYRDGDGPEIKVEVKDEFISVENNKKKLIPKAVSGRTYPVAGASAYDLCSGNAEVSVKVMYNYSSPTPRRIPVSDGKFNVPFVGEYAIVYEAADYCGNVSTEVLWVQAVASLGQDLTITVDVAQAEADCGEKVYVANAECSGGSGGTTLKIYVKHGGDVYEVDEGYFIPEKDGIWEVTYVATDFTGYSVTETYHVSAVYGADPVFDEYVGHPAYYVSGAKYVVPTVYARDYSSGSKVLREASLVVEDKNGQKTYACGQSFIPEVEATGDKVKIKYVCGNTYTKTYEVTGVKAEVNGRRNIEKLFVGSGYINEKTADGLIFSAAADGDFFWDFVNPVTAENALLTILGINGRDDFDKAEITFSDSLDPSVSVTAEIVNVKGGAAIFSVCGKQTTTKYGFGSIGLNEFTVSYASGRIRLGAHKADVTTADDGKAFKGFPSGRVRISVKVVDAKANSGFMLKFMDNHRLSLISSDKIKPRVTALEGYGGMFDIGSEYRLPRVTASDVMDPEVTFTVTVKDPDGNDVKDKNGVVLSGADPDAQYVVVLDKYGQYTVNYSATDSSGNKEPFTFALTIMDITPPTIVMLYDNNLEKRASVGDTAKMPEVKVTDDKTAADDIKVFRCVRNPMGELVYLGYDFEIKDGKKTVYEYSYKYVYAGEYKFMIYAIDEAGNQQMVSYTVVVG